MDFATLKQRTVSSLIWKLLERGGRSLVELVVQLVLARLLMPDQFGLMAIMLVFVNIGNAIVQSGLNTALVQDPEAGDEDCSTVFWMSLALSLGLYFVLFVSAPYIASFYQSPTLVWPLRILCLILIINAYNAVQVAVVQRNLEFRKVFFSTTAAMLFSGVVGVGLAFSGVGIWALVGQQISYQTASCIALAMQVAWRPQMVFKLHRAVKLFKFGWKLLVSGLLDCGYRSLSDLIIGKQFSATALGFVSQGQRYPQALGSMLDGAIQPVMLSAVSRMQDDIQCVKRLVRRALKTSAYLIMPVMATAALTAEPLVRLLLGAQWLPCVPFFQLYCINYALLPVHTSNLQALNGMGRSDIFLKLELVKKGYGLLLLLIAVFVFQDVYAIVGAGLLSSVMGTFVNAFPNKRVIGYGYFEQMRDVAPGAILAVLSALLSYPVTFLALGPLPTILLQVFAMAVVYLGASKALRLEEFEYLVSMAKRIGSKTKVS